MASFRGSLFMVFSVSERYKKGLPCNNGLLLFGWWVFFQYKKGVFAYVYAFLTPCKGAFEKTIPCNPFSGCLFE